MNLSEGNTKVWLLSHPTMKEMALNIIKDCDTNMKILHLKDESQRGGCGTPIRSIEYKNIINWKKFPDNWPNLFIENVKSVAGKDIIFLASFHSPEVIFEQLSIIYTLPKYLVRSFTLILPYFPTATMERVDTEGQIATAKTLAILVSAIPLTSRGPAKIIIYDIHALQERFYFSDKVIPRLETAIPLLLRAIKGIDNLCIVFPDEGAYKRFHLCFPSSQFADDMFVTCIKVRFGDSVRRVTIKEGDPVGKHCVIIDDLVMTGGTLLECAKLLISNGAKDVSAYVTHAVFPNESWKLFTPAYTNSEQDSSENASSSANSRQGIIENHTSPDKMGGDEDFDSRNGPVLRFSRFWITDSLPNSLTIAKNKPFVLLSLANVIADTLLGYDLCVS